MILRTSLSLAALSAALFACSSPNDEPADEPAPETEESEVRVCNATYARAWFVTLRDRSCGDVAGHRGAWIAEPLESDTVDAVCTMTWRGEKYSRADMDALRAFVDVQTEAMVPACSGALPDVGSLTPIPHVDILSHAGANGCDVCGKLRRDGKIVVILPPFRTHLRQFEVPLSDGTSRAFQIEAPQGASAVTLQLPATPPGVAYAADRVRIY